MPFIKKTPTHAHRDTYIHNDTSLQITDWPRYDMIHMISVKYELWGNNMEATMRREHSWEKKRNGMQ